jgi:PadR family transcriptional regulator, regulatory protein PadR
MKRAQSQFIQGTFELLLLRTLIHGPAHGHAIAQHIQQASDDLRLETGSLYPALHRLEAQGLVNAEWRLSDKGKRAKYYRLTTAGRKHLTAEHSRWDRFVEAMARVLRPVE